VCQIFYCFWYGLLCQDHGKDTAVVSVISEFSTHCRHHIALELDAFIKLHALLLVENDWSTTAIRSEAIAKATVRLQHDSCNTHDEDKKS
jgi:hypothetical protein